MPSSEPTRALVTELCSGDGPASKLLLAESRVIVTINFSTGIGPVFQPAFLAEGVRQLLLDLDKNHRPIDAVQKRCRLPSAEKTGSRTVSNIDGEVIRSCS